jgi:Xaa-Pro aminopeptidase
MPSIADQPPAAVIMAGVPEQNAAVYHRIRFAVVDQVAYIEIPVEAGKRKSVLILRDIEIERARRKARVDEVACPADYAPADGLSGDRETATAQAAAECLRRAGVKRVVGDRSLPLLFAELIRRAGIDVTCDPALGMTDRRAKDDQEIAFLREAQQVTEEVMARACRLIAHAEARHDGVLLEQGQPLTAERVRAIIDHWLIDRGYANPPSIVAGGPQGADCHELGHGPLRSGEPVILDIFPRNRESLYYGDCSRTVVHGEISDAITAMYAAVCRAKAAATAALRAGVTGEAVHLAADEAIRRAGFAMGIPPAGAADSYCSMVHGTGHGVGLDLHEPPLLAPNGPELVAGDVVTVEPGLYRKDLGGVRVEDMLVVTVDGSQNLNRLPEGLCWR